MRFKSRESDPDRPLIDVTLTEFGKIEWNLEKQHILNAHGDRSKKMTKCPHCPAILTGNYSLKTHIEDTHSDMEFYCKKDGCNMVFKKRNDLFNHRRLVHKRQRFWYIAITKKFKFLPPFALCSRSRTVRFVWSSITKE